MSIRYQPNINRQAPPRSIDLGSSSNAAGQRRPLLPISPPDTERNTPSVSLAPSVRGPHQSLVPEALHITPPTEDPSFSQSKRTSSVSYLHGGVSRPAVSPASATATPYRPSRWFVVVVPPRSLNTEPTLGHTLSTGPPGRFSSGILMPLFPTLYAQLTAIAKEFGMPSTAGVCLYLHINEQGMNMTPRISDEYWQLLWAPYFHGDESSGMHSAHLRLPITGQLEFDIDIRKARWYESWIHGHARQVSLEGGIPASIAHSMSKWYHDAQHLAHDEETHGEDQGSVRGKHVPRPLALARREGSVRSLPRYKAVNGRDNDTESVVTHLPPRKRLSPVQQGEEPASAAKNRDLDTLVRNWRATTPMVPAMPVDSAPNTLDSPVISELDLNEYQWSISSRGPPLEPLDFGYSSPVRSVDLDGRLAGSVLLTPSVATTWGADCLSTPSVSNASRYASPDMAARMLDFAPLTPSTHTSWGAPSYSPSAFGDSLLGSPDLGARAMLSPALTSSTATSWGAPDHWPASPLESFRASSPDLAQRAQLSPPHTAATATSWGAPETWPTSPVAVDRPHTPDLATRTFDAEVPRLWSVAKTTVGQPFKLVWPYHVPQKPVAKVVLSHAPASSSTKPASMGSKQVWPFLKVERSVSTASTSEPVVVEAAPKVTSKDHWSVAKNTVGQPFKLVWPYHAPQKPVAKVVLSNVPASSSTNEAPTASKQVWPFLKVERPVKTTSTASKQIWPFLKVERSVKAASTSTPAIVKQAPKVTPKDNWSKAQTVVNPYKLVWPFNVTKQAQTEYQVTLSAEPSHNKPSAQTGSVEKRTVWPFLKVEAKSRTPLSTVQGNPLPVHLPTKHLPSSTYPAVYPQIEIYPVRSAESNRMTAGVSDSMCQPVLLPGAQRQKYPVLEIYPSASKTKVTKNVVKLSLSSSYPDFNLYPAVYPAVTVYPTCTRRKTSTQQVLLRNSFVCYPVIDVYGGNKHEELSKAPKAVRIDMSAYPDLAIYPSVYPPVLYPPVRSQKSKPCKVLLQGSKCVYPTLVIYGAVSAVNNSVTVQVKLPWTYVYGSASLYAPVYPPMIYPEVVSARSTEAAKSLKPLGPVRVTLPVSYGRFNLYPATYPPVIYPAWEDFAAPKAKQAKRPQAQKKGFYYPQLVIYPSTEPIKSRCVYPQLEIYPAVKGSRNLAEPTKCSVKLSSAYGCFNLYPSTYPPTIYPQWNDVRIKDLQRLPTPKAAFYYPQLVIYPSKEPIKSRCAYPNLEIYPTIKVAGKVAQPLKRTVNLPSSYGRFNLYPSTYPPTIYPQWNDVRIKDLKRLPTPKAAFYYPQLVIYPSKEPIKSRYAYPNLEIYPTIKVAGKVAQPLKCTVNLPSSYGRFNLYPSTYPPTIYPQWNGVEVKARSTLPDQRLAYYPDIAIYEPLNKAPRRFPPVSVRRSTDRVCYYPQVQPYTPVTPPRSTSGVPLKLAAVYPAFDLYPSSYPPAIYPTAEPAVRMQPLSVVVTLSSAYPDLCIYPSAGGRAERSLPREVLEAQNTSVNLLESYKVVKPLLETPGLSKTATTPRRRKTHVELYVQVFNSVNNQDPRKAHNEVLAMLSPAPATTYASRPKSRKSHEDLHKEVFSSNILEDNGPASPVANLPVPSTRLTVGRARAPSISQGPQPRRLSLKSSQVPVTPAPPVPTVRARAGSVLGSSQDSTRTARRLSQTLNGQGVQRAVSLREVTPRDRTNSVIAQRMSMLMHVDDKTGSASSSSGGAKLTRSVSRLDKSKYKFGA